MNVEQYLAMCEQMGWTPEEEAMPKDASILSVNAQYALVLLEALPDLWDSMGGVWLGKDYSGLAAIMDIYCMTDKREIFELLKIAEKELGDHYEEKRRQQESMSKAKKAKG